MLGAPASFFALTLIAMVFLGTIVLVSAAYRSRMRTVGKVLAVAALVFVTLCAFVVGTFFLSAFYWPAGQVADGDFVVKSWRGDAFGHTNTIRALYFRGKGVTEYLAGYVHHPTRPALIIYEGFGDEDEPGATYAFDGATSRTLRLGPPYGLPEPEQWSPDQAKLAWKIQDELYLFDVERWRVTRLTGNATPPQEPHSMNLGGWSPGSRRFAVMDYGRRSLPGWQPAVLLQEWDAETLSVRTVDCMPDGPDRRAWQNTDFTWQDDSLVISPEGPRDARCADSPQ